MGNWEADRFTTHRVSAPPDPCPLKEAIQIDPDPEPIQRNLLHPHARRGFANEDTLLGERWPMREQALYYLSGAGASRLSPFRSIPNRTNRATRSATASTGRSQGRTILLLTRYRVGQKRRP